MWTNLYEKYIGCSCTEHAIRRSVQEKDYVFNIESLKCSLRKEKSSVDRKWLQERMDIEKNNYLKRFDQLYPYDSITSCESEKFMNAYLEKK